MQTGVVNKELPTRYEVVADSIRVGKENAILLDDIMIIANIRDKRNAYIIIEQLIVKHGYPIVASRKGEFKGYYIPSNKDEFTEAKKTFKNSINSMNKRYLSLIENFKEYNN